MDQQVLGCWTYVIVCVCEKVERNYKEENCEYGAFAIYMKYHGHYIFYSLVFQNRI